MLKMTKKAINSKQSELQKTEKKVVFDDKDKLILTELVRNPRTTDKDISLKTNIPIKTVNRRRKQLEEKNAITYMATINNSETGSKVFNAISTFTFYFNYGITRDWLFKIITSQKYLTNHAIKKHIFMDSIGEKDGRAAYTFFLVSRVQSDMIDILNAEILPLFEEELGTKPIFKIEEIKIFSMNKILHNYLPHLNIEHGRIKESVPVSDLFITE